MLFHKPPPKTAFPIIFAEIKPSSHIITSNWLLEIYTTIRTPIFYILHLLNKEWDPSFPQVEIRTIVDSILKTQVRDRWRLFEQMAFGSLKNLRLLKSLSITQLMTWSSMTQQENLCKEKWNLNHKIEWLREKMNTLNKNYVYYSNQKIPKSKPFNKK